MKKKLLSLLLVLVMMLMVTEHQTLAETGVPGVDAPGVAEIMMDAPGNISFSQEELDQFQLDGKLITFSGFIQFITEMNELVGGPTLTSLRVTGQAMDELGAWTDVQNIIAYEGDPVASKDYGVFQGLSFSDFQSNPWTVRELGFYRIQAEAVFSSAEILTVESSVFEIAMASPAMVIAPLPAPEVAKIILSKSGVSSNLIISRTANLARGKVQKPFKLDLIKEVRKAMGPGTNFKGETSAILINDVKHANPRYWNNVLEFLNGYGLNLSYTFDQYMNDLTGVIPQ